MTLNEAFTGLADPPRRVYDLVIEVAIVRPGTANGVVFLTLEGEVVHLVAKRLLDHTELLGQLPTASRDFC